MSITSAIVLGSGDALMPESVIQIVDKRTHTTVWSRRSDELLPEESLRTMKATISNDLASLDVKAFEERWLSASES